MLYGTWISVSRKTHRDVSSGDYSTTQNVRTGSMPLDAASVPLTAKMECLILVFHAKKIPMEEELEFHLLAPLNNSMMPVSAIPTVKQTMME